MKRLEGKTALISGGSSGIGMDIARAFLEEGASVVISGRSRAKLEESGRILGNADRLETHCGDVTVPSAAAAMVQHVVERWGRIDVLVNNAGSVRRSKCLAELTDAEWSEDIASNLTGVFLLCRAALPHMVARRSGSVITISSQLALIAAPKYPSYCAAKAGVTGLMRSIAIDYGADGVRANCVGPGLVDTPLARVERGDFDEIKGDIAKVHPLGRIGVPRDISPAVVYLASDESSWVTGQMLVVDGGFTAR